jgi:hypothetical protein
MEPGVIVWTIFVGLVAGQLTPQRRMPTEAEALALV